jgi:hypothetical protein
VPDRAFIKPLPYSWEHRVVGPLRSWHGRRGNHGRLESGLDDEPTKDTGEPIGKALPYAMYFCIIHQNEILPGGTTDALSLSPRLAFGLDLCPPGTYSCVYNLASLSSEAFGCVIGVSFWPGLSLGISILRVLFLSFVFWLFFLCSYSFT